jgi:hypothetical protein
MRIAMSVLVLMMVIFGCSKKSDDVEWADMDSFHSIMADAYHPLKDSSNLQPAKDKAEAMAAEADKWSQAELPDKVNNDEMKAMLAELQTGTKDFASQVKSNVPDSTLAKSLEELHNKFHKITEAWYAGGKEHEHH